MDFLIIGQGICGTFLSWYLSKAGLSFLVMDEQQPNTASVTAAGIINPVTGRRIVKTWMIENVLPFAKQQYDIIGSELQITAIEQKNIIDFFPTAQMRHAFLDRYAGDTQFISLPQNENDWRDYFNYDLGYGIINPCYLVNLQELLAAYRKLLRSKNKLLEEKFDPARLQVLDDGVRYENISASKIIFCDGIASATSLWFRNLPFAPNKGEMLLIEAAGIPTTNIFKRGLNLVPWNEDVFWAGSSYEWNFEHEQPTEQFRERTEAGLKQWLKTPFKVLDHRASVRPATLERRPFIGFHPQYPSIGILNGMGTKGCSLAPYFAQQFVQHIAVGSPLNPEANVQRFQKVLMRNMKS